MSWWSDCIGASLADRSGGGNVHRLVEEERGRGGTKEPGLVHNVLRSLSRATGRERSADRRKGD